MTGTTATDLDGLCATLFAGPLAHCAGALSFSAHAEAVAAADLDDRAVFDDLVGRFALAYPGAERRAVASFWSQYYFSRLMVALTAFCLLADRPLALDVRGLRVRFCADTGAPLCFHLAQAGPPRAAAALVEALYAEQVAGTVARLKRHSGLSARLLWENAGCYGTWILGEIARTCPAASKGAEALLADPHWPRAGCAMLPHLKCAALEGRPAVRRVCCLRYRLPGVGRCAGTCPLSPGAEG